MTKKYGHIFLSYSRKDEDSARALEQALEALDLRVWRDTRSIAAGTKWPEALENAIRNARGVAVLMTAASAGSDWVTYEYAFATGAQIPIVAVIMGRAEIPAPLRNFQIVSYSTPRNAAEQIVEGIRYQSRAVRRVRASTPRLVAKFQEENGSLCRTGKSIWLYLWIEDAPRETRSVTFEIMDLGFEDRKWTEPRAKGRKNELREFVTDEMNSYGDVEIWARGNGAGRGAWLTKSTLYEALVRYHGRRPANLQIRRGLNQIRSC